MNLKYSAVQQLSVCWNDVYRYILRFKRSESVKLLQENFGTLNFKHLCDLFRWKFLMTIINRYAYCEPLAEILDFQYHIHMLVYIADKYITVVLSAILLVRSVDTVQTCVTCNSLCVCDV